MQNKKHTLEWVKRQAKELKRLEGITHTQALERIALSIGYNNYTECQRALKDDGNMKGFFDREQHGGW